MSEESLALYEQLARREAEAAATASSPALASAHRLLAIQYEGCVDELRARHERHHEAHAPVVVPEPIEVEDEPALFV
jgi:hypothetical protein